MSENLGATAETAVATETPATTATETVRKAAKVQKVGKVVSTKMDKTIVVEVTTLKKHRLYKKAMKRTTKFKAHDPENTCKLNDTVRIEECRPISKEKHFQLIEIIKRGVQL